MLLLFFRVDAGDCRAGDLENCLVGAPDEETRVAHGRYYSDDPACGHHFVTGLELGDRGLQLSLFFCCGLIRRR